MSGGVEPVRRLQNGAAQARDLDARCAPLVVGAERLRATPLLDDRPDRLCLREPLFRSLPLNSSRFSIDDRVIPPGQNCIVVALQLLFAASQNQVRLATTQILSEENGGSVSDMQVAAAVQVSAGGLRQRHLCQRQLIGVVSDLLDLRAEYASLV